MPFLLNLQNIERGADSLAELGDGGFLSSDFELLQQVGRLSVQQVGQTSYDRHPSSLPRTQPVASLFGCLRSFG